MYILTIYNQGRSISTTRHTSPEAAEAAKAAFVTKNWNAMCAYPMPADMEEAVDCFFDFGTGFEIVSA